MRNFEEIYRIYHRYVWAIARKYSINHSDAEDIMQDVFLSLYEGMRQENDLKEDTNIKAWLAMVARNKALNLRRREGREEILGEVCDKADQAGKVCSAEEEYIKGLGSKERKEFCMCVLQAIREGSEEQYKAVMDSCCLNLTSKEIAEKNHTNCDCIDARIYRARKKAKKRFLCDYNRIRYA